MATKLICDGCGVELFILGPTNSGTLEARELTIKGDRADGMMGSSPVPNGEFHWCLNCAKIAFGAVREAGFQRSRVALQTIKDSQPRAVKPS